MGEGNAFRSKLRTGRSAIVMLILGLASCGTAEPRFYGSAYLANGVPLPRPKAVPHIVYVRPGDTVLEIARRNRIDPDAIVAWNGLIRPRALDIGQPLRLPPPRLHVVRPSETVFRIASNYDVPVEKLAALNGIDGRYLITPGQVLTLPSPPPPSSPPPKSGPAAGIGGPEAPVRAVPNPQPKISKPAQVAERPAANKQAKLLSGPTGSVPRPRPKPVAYIPDPRGGTLSESGFIWPLTGQIVSAYGPKSGGFFNDGINIAAAEGAPVRAVADGTVVYQGTELPSFGRLVLIRHDNGLFTAYGHNKDIKVRRGDRVRQGQVIARVGTTGSVSTPQLHFEVRRAGRPQDPRLFLPGD